MTVHSGGCHCGRVRFEVTAPEAIDVTDCNCSVCRMTGFLHLIVPGSDFRLVSGQNDIETYTFNTGVAKHYFCRYCGIKSFYVPRSHPDGISVNANCLDEGTVVAQRVSEFDGQHWEENVHKMSPIND